MMSQEGNPPLPRPNWPSDLCAWLLSAQLLQSMAKFGNAICLWPHARGRASASPALVCRPVFRPVSVTRLDAWHLHPEILLEVLHALPVVEAAATARLCRSSAMALQGPLTDVLVQRSGAPQGLCLPGLVIMEEWRLRFLGPVLGTSEVVVLWHQRFGIVIELISSSNGWYSFSERFGYASMRKECFGSGELARPSDFYIVGKFHEQYKLLAELVQEIVIGTHDSMPYGLDSSLLQVGFDEHYTWGNWTFMWDSDSLLISNSGLSTLCKYSHMHIRILPNGFTSHSAKGKCFHVLGGRDVQWT
mmetsp:Transcript_27494/g.53791  ORF Transcript_27494/g.53791 Transcript_27494/m.53791 type:complete len:303 (+) Transcript_27494:99-1007(+)